MTVLAEVKEQYYYRGIKPGKGKRRKSVYFTKYEEEARFYGGELQRVKIEPQGPLYSETAVDAAQKLGVENEYWKAMNKSPVAADDVLHKEAKRQGYDAIIRRTGDWIQVIDRQIITVTKPPRLSRGKGIRITPKTPRLR